MQAISDEKKITDVFIGYLGSVHDSRIFKNFDVYEKLLTISIGYTFINKVNINLFGKLFQSILPFSWIIIYTFSDYHILADSVYSCQSMILTPYRDNGHLTAAQANYNVTPSSCRVIIENSFGILKQRFRQLYYCKLKGIKKLCHFIRACCVLHNLADIEDVDFLICQKQEIPIMI